MSEGPCFGVLIEFLDDAYWSKDQEILVGPFRDPNVMEKWIIENRNETWLSVTIFLMQDPELIARGNKDE